MSHPRQKSHNLILFLRKSALQTNARILHATVADDFHHPHLGSRSDSELCTRHTHQDKVCPLCKQAGHSNANHFLRQCSFLPNNERHFMVKARQIAGILNNDQDTDYDLDPDLPVPCRHHFAEPRCHGLIWMSFMVTGLYMSSLRAARLEI